MIKVVVSGACGKMGKMVIRLLQEEEDMTLLGGIEREGHPLIGKEGISSKIEEFKHADVIIDFSSPKGSLKNLEFANSNQIPIVIGTTGFSKEEIDKINSLPLKIPCLLSPNMSIGVNIMYKIVRDVAKLLSDYDINIIESHHREKKDSPSGTAIKLGQIISEYKKNKIETLSIRAGDIVGEHSVIFCGMGERLEITHKAHTREIFARGAIKGAKWIINQKPGLYSMQDFLQF